MGNLCEGPRSSDFAPSISESQRLVVAMIDAHQTKREETLQKGQVLVVAVNSKGFTTSIRPRGALTWAT